MNQDTDTYVIDSAARRGLTTIACLTYELVSAATGSPIVVRGDDGKEYCLRLMTPDEAIESQRRALATTFPDGDGPPLISRAKAIDLTHPLERPWS